MDQRLIVNTLSSLQRFAVIFSVARVLALGVDLRTLTVLELRPQLVLQLHLIALSLSTPRLNCLASDQKSPTACLILGPR